MACNSIGFWTDPLDTWLGAFAFCWDSELGGGGGGGGGYEAEGTECVAVGTLYVAATEWSAAILSGYGSRPQPYAHGPAWTHDGPAAAEATGAFNTAEQAVELPDFV